MQQPWIAFEQPLNERVRAFLRLEHLFDHFHHCRSDPSEFGLRNSVQALLELFAVLGRSDLKTELIRDLTEQHGILSRLSNRSDVDSERLQEYLRLLKESLRGLNRMATLYPAAILRENDFLHTLHNRSGIPGGTCGFDIPAYHRWLSRPREETELDLLGWGQPLQPLEDGIRVYLQLMRASGERFELIADGGVYLHVPRANYQLLRVLLPPTVDAFAEISAGRHRFSFRFMALGDVNQRNVQVTESIPFELQCCILGHLN